MEFLLEKIPKGNSHAHMLALVDSLFQAHILEFSDPKKRTIIESTFVNKFFNDFLYISLKKHIYVSMFQHLIEVLDGLQSTI